MARLWEVTFWHRGPSDGLPVLRTAVCAKTAVLALKAGGRELRDKNYQTDIGALEVREMKNEQAVVGSRRDTGDSNGSEHSRA